MNKQDLMWSLLCLLAAVCIAFSGVDTVSRILLVPLCLAAAVLNLRLARR